MLIRKVTKKDAKQIYELYKAVSAKYPGRLTQYTDEIRLGYIEKDVIQKSLDLGLMLVTEKDGKIIASAKAYTSPYRCLSHVLTNGTLMSHPDLQTFRCGTALLKEFLKTIELKMPHIYMLEGLPHETNTIMIKFHKKCGMIEVGRIKDKIINNGTKEKEVILTWKNPNFKYEELLKYQKYLSSYLSSKYE